MDGNEHEELVEPSQEQIDMQIKADEHSVRLADMMIELQADPRFIELFQNRFINDWSVTQVMNMAYNTPEQDAKIFKKMKSRGEFSKFCNSIIEDAKGSRENLAAYADYLSDNRKESEDDSE